MKRYEAGLIGVGATEIVALAATVVVLMMGCKSNDSREEGSPSQSSTQGARDSEDSNLKSKIATTAGLVVPVAGNSSAPLRKQPGFGTQVLQQLPSGTRIVARQWKETPGKNTPDRWYQIELEADSSVSGWMHGDVLQFQQDSSNQLAGTVPAQPRPSSTTDLPSEDIGLVDTRQGWEWSDRCWRNLQAGNLRWARNECMMGINLPAQSPSPMSSLLYNLGQIEEREGAKARSIEFYKRSLALREHPEVRAALQRVEQR